MRTPISMFDLPEWERPKGALDITTFDQVMLGDPLYYFHGIPGPGLIQTVYKSSVIIRFTEYPASWYFECIKRAVIGTEPVTTNMFALSYNMLPTFMFSPKYIFADLDAAIEANDQFILYNKKYRLEITEVIRDKSQRTY